LGGGTGQIGPALVAGLLALIAVGWLSGPWTSASRAAFPGKDGRIFFASDRDGSSEIYSMKPNGTDQRRLTETAGQEFAPAVSANGRWVAFSFLPSDGSTRTRLVVMRADGSSRRNVTGDRFQADISPSFSPNGRRLVFTRETDPATENGRIWTIGLKPGSTGQQLITIAPARQYTPEYTPDGRKIFFTQQSLSAPFGFRIHSVRTDGQGLTPISPESHESAWSPTVGPGGEEVAYEANDGASPFIEAATIGGAAPLTRTIVPPLVDLTPYSPTFSPSGRRLAFGRANRPGEAPQINVVPRAGGAGTELPGPGAWNFEPDWAPRIGPPGFRVVRKPANRTRSRTAKFRFRASTRGTRLTCRLDRQAPRKCRVGRPVTFRGLKRGTHRLRVTPYLVDGTAAAFGLKSRITGQARNIRWRVR